MVAHMTLRAELAENWRENWWMRRQVACLPLMAAWLFVAWWFALGFAGFAAALLFNAAFIACGVKAGRAAGRLRVARREESARQAKEARELRTPRAPEAGPDQCPVCGLFGLNDLAADDAFMERGEASKVVAWGRQRAHWECAEFVPYVPPPHFAPFEVDGHKTYCACARCEPSATYPGVYSRCRFCGFYRRAESADAAKAYLIEHAKTCPKRPRPTAREIRAEFEALDARIRQQSAELDWMLRDKWKRRD